MNRRNFLKSTLLAGGAAASWPMWLKTAFAEDASECEAVPGPRARARQVAKMYRRAVRGGKPLLVIVIPENDNLKWEHGTRWGELLNHGSAAELAPLALAEVACATLSELRKVIPAAVQGDPMMLVVDTSSVPAKLRGISVQFEAPVDRWNLREQMTWEEAEAAMDRVVVANIAHLATAVRSVLIPDGEELERLAAKNRLAIGGDAAGELDARIASAGELATEAADSGAAIVYLAAERAGGRAQAVLHAKLKDTVVDRLKLVPPAGAHWGLSGGCGYEVEGDETPLMMACGMGHTPAKSRRFLYFFAQTPGERFRERLEKRESGTIEE